MLIERTNIPVEVYRNQVTYDNIEKTILEFAKRIEAPDDLLPDYEYSKRDEYHYVEIEGPGIIYLRRKERGLEVYSESTADLDELLYFVFRYITRGMASNYARKHRVENQDSRRFLFQKQKELLGRLRLSWEERMAKEIEDILKNAPFNDSRYCADGKLP
jgi:Immunity protein 63